jgi:diaminopimelate epimerase
MRGTVKISYAFSKMNGAGNDFIVFDGISQKVKLSLSERRALCRRGYSIGADGLIILEKPQAPQSHFRMRYYNANGKEADMCGNGARCAARFAFDNHIAPKHMTFETRAGSQSAVVLANGRVQLSMPSPTQISPNTLLTIGSKSFRGLFVNTGVPHFVTPTRNLNSLNVNNVAPPLRHHKAFGKNGSNINFVAVAGKNKLAIRTFERGVEGETLACGTGTVAAALWAHCVHKFSSPVAVKTLGGTLKISFHSTKNEFQNIVLEGPTALVLVGHIGPNAFD